MNPPVRLQRYLATAGVAARRKAEELIVAGRVKVNGKVVTVLGTKIDPDHDFVLVDGQAVAALDYFYVLFNKPKGCITAVTDDRGRPTVMDYLPNLPVPVKPVGRLDFYTEGVLLLTNDGELAARLLAPGNHVPKTYHVKVHGRLGRDDTDALREGITLDDGTTTMPAEVEILPGESKHTWLGITIHEGKHRQIHRMLEALGFQVDKLQRVAFANLTFHELRVGDARELTQQELNELRDLVGLDHRAVARGRWRAKREATDIPRRARAKARAEAEQEAGATALGHDADPRSAGWEPHELDEGDQAADGGARTEGGRGGGRSRSEAPAGSGGRSRGEAPASSDGRTWGGSRAGSGRGRGEAPAGSGGRGWAGLPAGRGRGRDEALAGSGGRSWSAAPTGSGGRTREGLPAGSGRGRGGVPESGRGKSGRDGAAAPRSRGSFGPTRPRPVRGSGGDREGDRAAAGGRWERGAGGAGSRDVRSGPGRRPDARRADRGREAPDPRNVGAAEGRSGRRSRDDAGAGYQGQRRGFGTRAQQRGRNK